MLVTHELLVLETKGVVINHCDRCVTLFPETDNSIKEKTGKFGSG